MRHEYLNSMSIFQLEALEDDQSLTVAAMQEQIHAKIDAMSPQLRELVLAAAPRPPRGGRGMGGMGGGFKGKQGGRRFRK